MNEFLSIKDVMKALKVCRSTVYKFIQGGGLVSYRVGRLVRITRGDLEAFVKSSGKGRLVRPKK
jgi:excisionase family DNA binding protein